MADKFKKSAQGRRAETNACDFLIKQGLQLIQSNFSARCGEIDLIMKDQNTVVFVEVRKRSHSHLGTAIESVTFPKQRRIVKTALLFLQKKGWLNKIPFRFDIVGIDGEEKVSWVKNAFSGC